MVRGYGGARRSRQAPTLHEPKAAPGEGTVIRARVGRPVPSGARSAQGPVHLPPTWRVMMRRCHPGQPGQGRRARAEGGMGAKREGANGASGVHRWGRAKAEGHEDCSSVCARARGLSRRNQTENQTAPAANAGTITNVPPRADLESFGPRPIFCIVLESPEGALAEPASWGDILFLLSWPRVDL